MRHDHCIALWRCREHEVELVRYWELERVSGIKHHATPLFSADLVHELLDELLSAEGLSLADIDAVWGTPGLGDALVPSDDALCGVSYHSLAHLFAGLQCDTEAFRHGDIVALAMDGGPDFDLEVGPTDEYYAGCVARRGVIDLVRPISSPAVLFKAARHLLGPEPGTLMALAGATSAVMDADVEALCADALPRLKGPGQSPFAFSLVDQLSESARAQFERRPDRRDPRFTADENVTSAVAKVIQTISEYVSIRNVEELVEESGIEPSNACLAMSGGFALNCPTNSLLMNKFGFRRLLAPPCANDGGQALGIGLLALHVNGELSDRSFCFGTPFRGREDLRVEEALERFAPWVVDVAQFDASQFVADIVTAPLAWVYGAAEVGPRALGHRSLLGDPRTSRTRDALNNVKQRQWWRPVAPIVLEDEAGEWFVDARPSPYMLEVFDVRPDKRDQVSAVVHLDGTARVQTLSRPTDPFLYEAIRAFGDECDVPMLCNTSLNDKGEPIVDDAVQALNFCVRKGVRVAYLAGHRVELRTAAETPLPDGPHCRERARFDDQDAAQQLAYQYWSDEGVAADTLFAIARSPALRRLLRSQDGARKARIAASVAANANPVLARGMERARTAPPRNFRFDGVSYVDEDPYE